MEITAVGEAWWGASGSTCCGQAASVERRHACEVLEMCGAGCYPGDGDADVVAVRAVNGAHRVSCVGGIGARVVVRNVIRTASTMACDFGDGVGVGNGGISRVGRRR